MEKYDYLKKFINNNVAEFPRNSFSKINLQDIKDAEHRLGFEFPKSLKEFWLEIGKGVLNKSIKENPSGNYPTNYIFSPNQIADIMLLREESDYILPEAVEYIEKGYIKGNDIIFFEIGDMSSFLVMKPSSNKPDAIYSMLGILIEEDFEKFIWRLYHESSDYYLDISLKQLDKYDLSLDQLVKLYEENADLDEPIKEVAQIFSMDPSIVKLTLEDHIRYLQRVKKSTIMPR